MQVHPAAAIAMSTIASYSMLDVRHVVCMCVRRLLAPGLPTPIWPHQACRLQLAPQDLAHPVLAWRRPQLVGQVLPSLGQVPPLLVTWGRHPWRQQALPGA